MPRAPKVKLPRTVSLFGRRWRVLRWFEDAEPRCNRGECHIDDGVIWIHPDLEGQELVDTLIHEIGHAADERAAEKRVTAGATAAARFLRRAGLI